MCGPINVKKKSQWEEPVRHCRAIARTDRLYENKQGYPKNGIKIYILFSQTVFYQYFCMLKK